MNESKSTVTELEVKASAEASKSRNMSAFFAIAYVSQGLSCAQFGVISQPLQFFMMAGLKLSAADVAANMAILMLPWVWKPAIGIITDFLPIAGYRRKSYLLIGFTFSAIAYALILMSAKLQIIMSGIFVAAICMSMSTALMVGMAVELGRADGRTRQYFRIQEIFYYAANIAASIISGALCQSFGPNGAFSYAVGFATIPMIVMIVMTTLQVKEEKSPLQVYALSNTLASFKQAFKSPFLWMAAAFSLFWNFMPAFGVPLYFYESKQLLFSQASIGQLAAWNSFGMLIAALLHKRLMDRLSAKMQLIVTTLILSVTTLAYLALSTPETAIVLEIFRGMANMLGILGVYCFAAEYCPKRIEVTVMALLVGLRNVATNTALFTGGQLFTNVFPNNFSALVIISALAPLLALPMILLQAKADKNASTIDNSVEA
ncbi:MAG: MFS transporter [Candidatus Obscuribacterales bacterium]|jgi:predicted MFS family arabinose efflux permease|nr:MFS transporter [Candidatus Obscuribacterales bacterium]